jgi:hypothetical protein
MIRIIMANGDGIEFLNSKKISSAQPGKSASLIHNQSTSKFFDCLAEAYCYRKSRELSPNEYLQFAEVLHELV